MVKVSRGPISVLDPYSTISAGPFAVEARLERVAIVDLGRQEAIFLEEEDRPRLRAPRVSRPLAGWASRAISGRFMCSVASECSTTISTSAAGLAWP